MQATDDFDEIVVLGTHGYATTNLAHLEQAWGGSVTIKAAVNDLENGFIHPELGCPVISSEERFARFPSTPVMLGVGDSALRERMTNRLVDEGAILATVHPDGDHPTVARRSVVFGAGSVVMPVTVLGPNITIGAGAYVAAQLISHDSTIGDFSNVAFGAILLGHLEIGRGVNIAPGATISNGTANRPLRIGDGAVIGAGAVVSRDVEPGARMVGNPAMTVAEWRRLKALLAEDERGDLP